jgi:GNAT superfamily N-acetyltransferase
MQDKISCKFRQTASAEDKQNIRNILDSSGFFYDFEIDVAVELLEEYLKAGAASGYIFIFAEVEGQAVGYTCFGLIPCTRQSYDIYWIGVHDSMRGKGIGAMLLAETEQCIREMDGNGIYLETSSREKYIPTHNFYYKCGYKLESQIRDFYDFGDDKMIFVKRLRENNSGQ